MYSVASRAAFESTDDRRTGRHTALDLILGCAASPFTAEHAVRLDHLVREDFDWDEVTALAESQGLVPLAYKCLASLPDVPACALEKLRARAERNARQALWLTQLLHRITTAFEQRGIAALPYKGPVLAELLYHNVSMRQYSDLDILVRSADLPRARNVLEELGFTAALPLTPRQERADMASGYECVFDAPGTKNVVELQWRILPRFYAINFDVEGLFDRARPLLVGGKTIQTLSNEDSLLVLCAHAAKHSWANISWVRDIAELDQSTELDWDSVISTAGQLGIRRIVGISFLLANQLLGAPPPSAVQRFVEQDSHIPALTKRVSATLELGTEPDVESLGYFRLMCDIRENRADKLRFGTRLALTPTISEWSLLQLPAIMFPLYGAIRIGRLVGKLMRRRQ